MKRVFGERRTYWIAGILVGLTGVVSARLVAPELEGIAEALAAWGGYTLVIIAITILGLATRRGAGDAYLTTPEREAGRWEPRPGSRAQPIASAPEPCPRPTPNR